MRAFLLCFSSFSENLIRKMSPLVLAEILGMFANTLTADAKYPIEDCENWQLPILLLMASILFQIPRICNSQFKCNFLNNEKLLINFLFDFWIQHLILNTLKENMIFIANVNPKLQIVKKLVRPLSKRRRFRTCFDSEDVKASQILAKSQWERFYHVFSSFSGKFIWRMSALELRKILLAFFKTLTADGK